MNNKVLLIALVVMIIVIGVMSWKINSVRILGAKTDKSPITLSTSPNPLRLGRATFMIDVVDENGRPVDNARVQFDLNMTTMNMGTQQGNASSQGNGRYSAEGNLSMRGLWRMRTTAKMPDGSTINKDFTVNVP